ncbi:hypothetical protein [Neotamlana sedimentorum]|uniref:hypothetical protein n=1 Tax=Neotamlana sedimentorum TaxID=1435349 RepID=UPI00069C0122|nr:hypothetical protein [Tamlana sedimentorum]
MRLFITAALVFCLIFSCKTDSKNQHIDAQAAKKQHTLIGVWEMVGYYNYRNNKILDSFMSSDSYKQIKIYTPTKVMWSRLNKLDSTDYFGYGDYKTTDSTLHENLVFGSNVVNKFIDGDHGHHFYFELELDKNKFSQIELDENGDRILAENYMRIE